MSGKSAAAPLLLACALTDSVAAAAETRTTERLCARFGRPAAAFDLLFLFVLFAGRVRIAIASRPTLSASPRASEQPKMLNSSLQTQLNRLGRRHAPPSRATPAQRAMPHPADALCLQLHRVFLACVPALKVRGDAFYRFSTLWVFRCKRASLNITRKASIAVQS